MASSNSKVLILTEEQILSNKKNPRVVLVPTSHSKNKKGYAFLAFCNNDKGILNGAATPVCLYNQQWHCLDHVDGRPHLGRQICEKSINMTCN